MLTGKVAVVTGGTRGIGRAVVEKFLRNHAHVVLCGSRQATADRAVDELKTVDPSWYVEGIAPDLTRYESVKGAFQSVLERHGHIDILVNNAGVSSREPFAEYTPELFRRVMALNVESVFHCTRAVYEAMAAQGGGVILNTGSMVTKSGQPSGMAYPAGKAAVDGLTVSLARELGPLGIRVNAVAPGIVDTDMTHSVPPEVLAPLTARIPLRRIADPGEIAGAFLFLASPAAAYITGEILHVDGGAFI